MRFTALLRAVAAVLPFTLAAAASNATSTKLCFPDSFLLGSATASYQVEGGVADGGRTPSIWDDFCRRTDGIQCANVADDFYHRYSDDINMMGDAGFRSFRFSISWSRAMTWDPATKHMKANPAGLAYYHAVVDHLKARNIVPVLTIYHWDLPDELHTQLSPPSWLNEGIQDHFLEYAELLYKEFGKDVTHWATFNEPWTFVVQGYGTCSRAPAVNQTTTNAYIATHNVLLAHSKAVAKFHDLQKQGVVDAKGRIGIVLNSDWAMPLDASNPDDVAAADRKMQFYFGWFLDPITTGDYPKLMRERVGDRLPKFTEEQSKALKGSYDLLMLNHYATQLITSCDSPRSKRKCSDMSLGWEADMGVDDSQLPPGARESSPGPDGKPLCDPWFRGYPKGYREVMRWMHQHDPKADILLTENGWCGNAQVDNKDQLWYHQTYLEQVYHALTDDKIPIIGYTAWSLMDNYEWGSFNPRFGLYYVNFTSQVGSKDIWVPKATDLARIPRPAATWFSQVAKTGCMEPTGEYSVAAPPAPAVAVTSSSSRTAWIVIVVVILVIAGSYFAVTALRRRQAANAGETSRLLA